MSQPHSEAHTFKGKASGTHRKIRSILCAYSSVTHLCANKAFANAGPPAFSPASTSAMTLGAPSTPTCTCSSRDLTV
eukprot:5089830-Pleurochrysis_carterae.AAC.3